MAAARIGSRREGKREGMRVWRAWPRVCGSSGGRLVLAQGMERGERRLEGGSMRVGVLFGSRGGTRPWITRKEPVLLESVSGWGM